MIEKRVIHGFYFPSHLTQGESIIPRKQTAAHFKVKAGNVLLQREELARESPAGPRHHSC